MAEEEKTPEQRIAALLETHVKQLEERRVYTTSPSWGTERYHIVEFDKYSGLTLEQIDTGEKWSKRVQVPVDEIPQVLKSLLLWYLEHEAERETAAKTASELMYLDDNEQTF